MWRRTVQHEQQERVKQGPGGSNCIVLVLYLVWMQWASNIHQTCPPWACSLLRSSSGDVTLSKSAWSVEHLGEISNCHKEYVHNAGNNPNLLSLSPPFSFSSSLSSIFSFVFFISLPLYLLSLTLHPFLSVFLFLLFCSVFLILHFLFAPLPFLAPFLLLFFFFFYFLSSIFFRFFLSITA